MALTPEERERLRLTLAGMVNAAWGKYPKASAGDLVDAWRQVVTEADKRQRAHRRPKARTPETAQREASTTSSRTEGELAP